MAKTNIESVIAKKKTLEELADCMCCPKIFNVPHKQCFYCKEFKTCKRPRCSECTWSIDNGGSDVCLPWLAHDLLTSINTANESNLEKKTDDLDR